MEVLKLIQENPRWEQILAAAPYYVTAKWDGDYVLLKYNQLASDFTNPIVRECRGCIFYLPHKNHKLASVVCFPFTKFGNYGESYVPEIDWATAKVQEKVDGCFTKWDKVMLADGTSMPIGEIVNNKLDIEVMSYNFTTKQIEPKKVIGWKRSKELAPLDQWRTISLRKIKTCLKGKLSQHCIITPTLNHLFFRKNNNGDIEEVEARYLNKGDILLTPKQGLTPFEKQIILGTLLGDGSCTYYQEQDNTCDKGIRFTHSRKQKEYVEFKARFLTRLGGAVQDIEKKGSFNPEKTHYQSLVHSGITACYDIAYTSYKKAVTEQWLNELDWLGIAIWYMDDGSRDKTQINESLHLHTEGFSDKEQEIIQKYFEQKGIKTTIREDGRGYHFIHVSTQGAEIIWQNIRTFVPPCMQYKLPARHQGYYVEDFGENQEAQLFLAEGIIEDIQEGLHAHNNYHAKAVTRYDIEVEDNHNYFCQGCLVHNSLIKMWYHNDRWHVSTNGTIDAAEAPTNFENVNFHDIVMRAIEAKGDPIGFFDTLNPRYTYMFELVSPETRVTIAYPETKLYFLGCRDMVTFEEKGVFSQTLSFVSRVAQPKRYPLSSLEDCLNAVAAMKADEEGFVICDAHYNRIKIKSPEYLIASRIRNNGAITTRTILELIREDKLDDFLAYAEDYQGFVDEVIKGYNNLITAYNDAIQLVFFSDEYDIVDKRDLALQTTHLPTHIRAILFAYYDHKISNVYDWVAALPISTLTELVKKYKVAA